MTRRKPPVTKTVTSMKRLALLTLFLAMAVGSSAQNFSGTYLYEKRDTCDLFLDVYEPSPGSEAGRPTVLFVFGGGFVGGQRNEPFYHPWFKLLNDNGFRVVAIDYRLGLKGVDMRFDLFHLIDASKKTQKAVNMGVEDVFSAVNYLCRNKDKLGIDPSKIVLAGNSAGAMISLSSEWEECNRTPRAQTLPEDFRFAGVISFAGAIMSDTGKPRYLREPCPQLLIHGTDDAAVTYKKTSFAKRGMWGSSYVAEILEKQGFSYQIFRYVGHTHDMAANLVETWPEQIRFLEENVIASIKRTIDATLDDPAMTVREEITLSDIYK